MAITINGNNAATAGGIGYGDGTNLVFTTAGTSGQILTSSGTGAPTWSSTVPTVNLTTGVTGILPVANGGTNSNAVPTAGGIGYGTGTAHAYTAAGTSGQVLQSSGAGAPVWVTPATGAMTLISTQTASGTDVAFTGLSTYNNYMISVNSLFTGSGLSPSTRFQLGTGATPTYQTTSYSGYYIDINSSGTTTVSSQSTYFAASNSQNPSTGVIFLTRNQSGNTWYISGNIQYSTGVSFVVQSVSLSAALTAIKFLAPTSGYISLYGISG